MGKLFRIGGWFPAGVHGNAQKETAVRRRRTALYPDAYRDRIQNDESGINCVKRSFLLSGVYMLLYTWRSFCPDRDNPEYQSDPYSHSSPSFPSKQCPLFTLHVCAVQNRSFTLYWINFIHGLIIPYFYQVSNKKVICPSANFRRASKELPALD